MTCVASGRRAGEVEETLRARDGRPRVRAEEEEVTDHADRRNGRPRNLATSPSSCEPLPSGKKSVRAAVRGW
jgi:hypothetical protein